MANQLSGPMVPRQLRKLKSTDIVFYFETYDLGSEKDVIRLFPGKHLNLFAINMTDSP